MTSVAQRTTPVPPLSLADGTPASDELPSASLRAADGPPSASLRATDAPDQAVHDLKDPWLGRLIDQRYRLESLLGHGSTGRVYRARQERTDRSVAVKLLHESLSHDAASVRRFQREARIACRVNHPNAITVHDCGVTEDGRCYLVTELLEGDTLRAVLDREGLLPPERALALFRGILGGVAAAHAKGVIHRELHPGNILICGAGQTEEHVKVFDFGGARLQDSDGDTDVTGAGHLDLSHLLGRVRYLPPERLQRDCRPDLRSDVYALGLILYELCTGVHPFDDADDPLLLMAMQLNRPPPLLREVRPERWFAPALQGLLAQLLAKNPDERPANACEVAQRLQHLEQMGALLSERPLFDPDDEELELEMEALPADESGEPPKPRAARVAPAPLPGLIEPAVPVSPIAAVEKSLPISVDSAPHAEQHAAPRLDTPAPRLSALSLALELADSAVLEEPPLAATALRDPVPPVPAPLVRPATHAPGLTSADDLDPAELEAQLEPPAVPEPPAAPATRGAQEVLLSLFYLLGSAALVFSLGLLALRYLQGTR